MYAYNASNTSGHTKKVIILYHIATLFDSYLFKNTINAITLVSFGVGNIIGTEIFQPKDAPAYIPGKIAILVLLTVQLFICYLLRWINIRMNKKRLEKLEEEKARRGWTDEDVRKERERHAFLDLTDKQYVPAYNCLMTITDSLSEICSLCTLRKLCGSNCFRHLSHIVSHTHHERS